MLILASKSPRRKTILQSMGLEFQTFASSAEEISGGSYFEDIPMLNAVMKARDIASQHPEALVLGADTVVECDGMHFNKPGSRDDAEGMLLALSGKEHVVVTGVCLECRSDNLLSVFAEKSFVRFKSYGLDTVRNYMELVDVMDKAGAYAVQEHGSMIIDNIRGSVTNVVGLPSEKLAEALSAPVYAKFNLECKKRRSTTTATTTGHD